MGRMSKGRQASGRRGYGAGRASCESGANRCLACGYEWFPRSSGRVKSCPRCRSTAWDKEFHKAVCSRCGHEWLTYDERPERCPSCRSRVWDAEVLDVFCRRCGARWKDPVKKGAAVICLDCGPAATLTVMRRTKGGSGSDGVRLTTEMLSAVRAIPDDAGKADYLVSSGLPRSQAEIIVRLERGEKAVHISKETGISLEDVLAVSVPHSDLCSDMSRGSSKRGDE